MPKSSCPLTWITEHGGSDVFEYLPEEDTLRCLACRKSLPWKNKPMLRRHIQSIVHERSVKLKEGQDSSLDSPQFSLDLVKMLIACNISVNKTRNRSFMHFIEKYTGRSVPTRMALMQNIKNGGKLVLDKIRALTEGQDVYIQWDENRDALGKPTSAVFVGLVNGQFLSRPMLINLSIIQARTVDFLIGNIKESLNALWGEGFDISRIQFFIMDGISAFSNATLLLKQTLPHIDTFKSNDTQGIAVRAGAEVSKVSHVLNSMKKILKTDMTLPKFLNNATPEHLRAMFLIQWNMDLIDL